MAASGPYDDARLFRVSLAKGQPVSAYFLIGQRRISRCDVYTSSDQGVTWQPVSANLQSSRASVPVVPDAALLDGQAIGLGVNITLPIGDMDYAAQCSLIGGADQEVANSHTSFIGTGKQIVVWFWVNWIISVS